MAVSGSFHPLSQDSFENLSLSGFSLLVQVQLCTQCPLLAVFLTRVSCVGFQVGCPEELARLWQVLPPLPCDVLEASAQLHSTFSNPS